MFELFLTCIDREVDELAELNQERGIPVALTAEFFRAQSIEQLEQWLEELDGEYALRVSRNSSLPKRCRLSSATGTSDNNDDEYVDSK